MIKVQEEFLEEVRNLFETQTPAEVEDILFDVFADANIPDLQNDIIADRAKVHSHLRKLLRTLSQNPEFLKSL